jgi:hypothetical protein
MSGCEQLVNGSADRHVGFLNRSQGSRCSWRTLLAPGFPNSDASSVRHEHRLPSRHWPAEPGGVLTRTPGIGRVASSRRRPNTRQPAATSGRTARCPQDSTPLEGIEHQLQEHPALAYTENTRRIFAQGIGHGEWLEIHGSHASLPSWTNRANCTPSRAVRIQGNLEGRTRPDAKSRFRRPTIRRGARTTGTTRKRGSQTTIPKTSRQIRLQEQICTRPKIRHSRPVRFRTGSRASGGVTRSSTNHGWKP